MWLWIACELRMALLEGKRASPLHASPLPTVLCSKKRKTERCAINGMSVAANDGHSRSIAYFQIASRTFSPSAMMKTRAKDRPSGFGAGPDELETGRRLRLPVRIQLMIPNLEHEG